MTFYVDMAAGSRNLPPYLAPLGIPVVEVPPGRLQSDVEFLGLTAIGPSPIGIEHKSAITGDAFTSLFDGRLTGTQIPRMVRAYPTVRYVIIEGPTRRSAKDGVLEISKRRGSWEQAAARKGHGITWDEYENRLESIREFWSAPHVPGRTEIVKTFDEYETAAWLARCFRYWQKPYEDHHSAGQWDRAGLADAYISPGDVLLSTTSQIPLAIRWARELDGIAQKKATFIGEHFKSGYNLANASPAEWQLIEFKEQSRKDHSLRIKHFSKEIAEKIVNQIRGG